MVWDLGLRVFHWVLAALVVAALWLGHLGPIIKTWHFWAGYGIAALLIFRLVWGFCGGRHARFRDFLRGPRVISQYAGSLPERRPSAWPGHNPIGGLAVIVVLLLLAVQVGTGLFADDEVFSAGPLAGTVTEEARQRASAWHGIGGWLVISFIALHLGAMVFYAFWKRENLVLPMITGRKDLSGDINHVTTSPSAPDHADACRRHASRKLGLGRHPAALD